MLGLGRTGFLLSRGGWVGEEHVVRFLRRDEILYGGRLRRDCIWRGEGVIWCVTRRQAAIFWQLFLLVPLLFSLPLFVSARILVEVCAEQLRQTRRACMFRGIKVDSDGGEPCGVSSAGRCCYEGRLVFFCDRVHAFRSNECAVALHRCCCCSDRENVALICIILQPRRCLSPTCRQRRGGRMIRRTRTGTVPGYLLIRWGLRILHIGPAKERAAESTSCQLTMFITTRSVLRPSTHLSTVVRPVSTSCSAPPLTFHRRAVPDDGTRPTP